MGGYVIEEDRVKLALYTLANLIVTLLLMMFTMHFVGSLLILAFLGITGIWFSVKAMFRYGKKLVLHTPVCEFKKKELVIYSLPRGPVTMQYRKIKEVKVLRDWKSIKLFFASDDVKHPSGWNYAGVIWPFRRKELEQTEAKVVELLKSHHLTVNVVEK